MKSLAAALALSATLACDKSGAPVQPEPLTDCTILGVAVPRTLEVGETRRLTAFLEHCRPMYFPLASDQVTWKSLDSGLASVSGDTLTAIAPGPAIVQCTFGEMTQQAVVVVHGMPQQPGLPAPVLRMYGSPVMAVDQRAEFGAFVIGTNGTVTHVSSSAAWASSNLAVAAPAGLWGDIPGRAVDAFSQGRTRITASYQGMAAAMSVQVGGQVSSQ
jgi:hypothetical protein